MRRRIYLMRHAQVAYFETDGRPLRAEDVSITAEGEEQARAAATALADMSFDRVITSGLPRTVETARIVAPDSEPEAWSDFREIEAGRLGDIPEDEVEHAFVGSFRGIVPGDTRFLGGETVAAFADRVLAALEELLADRNWDVVLAVLHATVNRAILTHALTGGRAMLGNFEQAPACVNVLDVGESGGDWIVRAVNVVPNDLAYPDRTRTMEELFEQYLPYRRSQ